MGYFWGMRLEQRRNNRRPGKAQDAQFPQHFAKFFVFFPSGRYSIRSKTIALWKLAGADFEAQRAYFKALKSMYPRSTSV